MNADATAQSPGRFGLTMKLAATAGLTEEARSNRQIVLAAYEALARGEWDRLMAILDPDVQFHEAASLPYGGTAQGVGATMAGVQAMVDAWGSMNAEVEEITAGGDLVIVYLHVVGTARNSDRRYEGVGVEAMRMKNGKVIEWRPIYWDTHAATEVMTSSR